MDSRPSLGVRRHHRARSLEPIGHAPGGVDFLYLESSIDRRGARHDSSCHGSVRPVLFAATGKPCLNKLLASLLAGFAAAACTSPSDEDMARCAAVVSREARLECYDGLAHRPPDKAPSAEAAG